MQTKYTDSIEFKQLMDSLKGGITLEEAIYLAKIAGSINNGCIVEVGSFRGKSAVALAVGVRDSKQKKSPQIYCIEPHQPFTGFYGGNFGPQDRKAFYETMITTEAFNEVALINLSSETITPSWNQPVGLIFIDGDHHYLGVKRDFNCWEPHLLPGCLVAFDDATDPNCGPNKLIHEILATNDYEVLSQKGKIITLKKKNNFRAYTTNLHTHKNRKRILVLCHSLIRSGGLLRFDRVASVIKNWNYELYFLPLSNEIQDNKIMLNSKIITKQEALNHEWDVTMVPGAGFPEHTIKEFGEFKKTKFGLRIQHILNNTTKKKSFLTVNKEFKPHIVLFNNDSWSIGTYTEFQANQFYFLIGGIDTRKFYPTVLKVPKNSNQNIYIGGQANKNPEALIKSLEHLPPNFIIKLFGNSKDYLKEKYKKFINEGRLELLGSFDEPDLIEYYKSIDIVVSTEQFSGWCNIGAEALACGIPLICTQHGTSPYAYDGQTALILDKVEPRTISEKVIYIANNPEISYKLSKNGRTKIIEFDWNEYSAKLCSYFKHDYFHHYIRYQEKKLFGKWPIETRLYGLQDLIKYTHNKTVLDFASAEGIIAYEFLKNKAKYVLGIEIDCKRVEKSNNICSEFNNFNFYCEDLNHWDKIKKKYNITYHKGFDIVLYLGIHHHLPKTIRQKILVDLLNITNDFFAIRTPKVFFNSENIEDIIISEGFLLINEHEGDIDSSGDLKIFKKG